MEQTLSTNNQGIKTQIAQLEDAIRRKQKVVDTTLTRWGSYPSQNADEQWIKRARKQLFVLNAALKNPRGNKPAPLSLLTDENANKLNESGYNLRDAYRVLNFGKSPTDYVRRTDGTSGTRIGAARQFSKILGFEPADYMRPNSPALKLLGKYANGLDQNQGSMDDMLDYIEHQEGVTNWSKHQQEQALRNNPDLAQIGGLEHFGRNVVRGVFHPSAVIREEIGGDKRTADQITQGEKVTNFLADVLLNYALTEGASSAMQGVKGGVAATDGIRGSGLLPTSKAFVKGAVKTALDASRGGFIPANAARAPVLYQAGKALVRGIASHVANLAPETVINARKAQNLTNVPFSKALGSSARDTANAIFTTKYYRPNEPNDPEFGLGDRLVGIANQAGLLYSGAKLGAHVWDETHPQLKPNVPARVSKLGRNELWEQVGQSLAKKDEKVNKVLGPVERRTAEQVYRATGIDISGRFQRLTADRIRHTDKQHGNATAEAKRGQVAVAPSDYMTIREVIGGAQQIREVAPDRMTGERQIEFAKAYPDGTTYVVLTLQGKKAVNVASIYRLKNRKIP